MKIINERLENNAFISVTHDGWGESPLFKVMLAIVEERQAELLKTAEDMFVNTTWDTAFGDYAKDDAENTRELTMYIRSGAIRYMEGI